MEFNFAKYSQVISYIDQTKSDQLFLNFTWNYNWHKSIPKSSSSSKFVTILCMTFDIKVWNFDFSKLDLCSVHCSRHSGIIIFLLLYVSLQSSCFSNICMWMCYFKTRNIFNIGIRKLSEPFSTLILQLTWKKVFSKKRFYP